MASILDEFLILFKPTVKGNGLTRLNRDLKQTHSNLFSMKNLFGAFIGYDIYSGIKAIGSSLIDASREMGAMRSRFFAITQDEKKANEELEWAFKLAQKTAMPMKALADSYSIFFAATQKGLGTSGAREVFQDWTEVSRVLHLSEYQFERVTYALREMASKGAIYSQDLRMQIGTHVPNAIGLAQKAAEDLGITGTDWFEKLQEQAKGNQKLINQFITLFSKHAKDMYADSKAVEKALKQPDAQIIRLRQQWDKLRYAMADSGFTDDLMKVLMVVNDTLDKITSNAKEFYKLIKDIAKLMIAIGSLVFFRRITKFILAFALGSKTVLGRITKLIARLGVGSFAKLLTGVMIKRFFTLGVRGALAFIPIVGQIISLLWIIWDVIQVIWKGTDVFFPNLKSKIAGFIKDTYFGFITMISLIVFAFNPLIAVILFITGLVVKLIDKFNLIEKFKNKFSYMMNPDKEVWREYQNKVGSTTSEKNVTISNGGAINQTSYINIDATGLSEEQAANMIADAQAQSQIKLLKAIGNDIKYSKIG